MADYYAPGSFTDLGFQPLYKTFRWTHTPPDTVPAISDPRGYFKGSGIPSKVFSYRTLLNCTAFSAANFSPFDNFVASPLGLGLLANVAGASFTFDFLNCRFKNRVALVTVEGKDVIDMPTEGLVQEGNIITLPNKVLRLIHAGEEKLVPDDDNRGVSYWATLAVHGSLKGNLAKGVKPQNPTDDLLTAFSQGNSLLQSDTSSNQVIVEGKPKYISYVAITKPLFRDVLSFRGTALAFGISNPLIPLGFEITSVGAGSLALENVQRFAYVREEQPKQDDPKVKVIIEGWRISESFEYTPSTTVNDFSPQQISTLTKEQKISHAYSSTIKWYAYDVTQKESEAYNVLLAQLMMLPSSKFYKKGFKAIILDQQQGTLGYGKGLIDWYRISPSANNGVSAQFYYTSPVFNIDLSNTARIGQEYFYSLEGGIKEFEILARTSQTASGMALLYDRSTSLSFLVDSSTSGLLEKMYDDNAWVTGGTIPESKTSHFQLGEYPYRSKGQSLLTPRPIVLDEKDEESLATMYTLETKDGDPDTFKLFTNEEDEVPFLEMSADIWPIKDKQIIVGIPPTSKVPTTKEGGGFSKITRRWGNKPDTIVLPAQTGDKNSTDPSEFQIANIEDLKFPVKAGNPTNIIDPLTGIHIMAYEIESRIDIAVRTTYKDPFSIIRDITLRVNEAGDINPSNLPVSSQPSLTLDLTSRTIFLFYMYKNLILVKQIPYEIFISHATPQDKNYSEYNMFTLEEENNIIKTMHKITPNLVHAQNLSKASRDMQLGKIKIQKDVIQNGIEFSHYCTMIDKAGFLYAFIESNGRIIVRTSSNLGAAWTTAISEKFTFYPKRDTPKEEATTETTETETEETHLSCPYVLYDEALDVGHLFYVIDQTLLCVSIAMGVFRNKDTATCETDAVKYVFPKVVYGPLTKDMFDRKISKAIIDPEGQENMVKVANQRVTGLINSQGYYRVFFKDTDGNIRSVISSNSGTQWYEDDKYVTPVIDSGT